MPITTGRRAGTWRVTLFAHGKQHEWIVEGKKKDAESFLARQRVDLEVGKKLARGRAVPTFNEFSTNDYEPHAKKHLAPSTWTVRICQVATLREYFGPLRITELSVEHVEKFKERRKVGASSVNNELRVFRTMLTYASSIGLPVPALSFKKLPVRGAARARTWTTAQVAKLYEQARALAPELLPILVFLVNTGCRKGEAIAAEWSWVDEAAGMLRIPSNEVWRPKNGMPREVPLSDAVRAILAGPKAHARWVFPTRHGGRRATFPKDLFWRVRDAAGLDGGVHTTRHTYASHFLAAVPDLFLLAQVLGHSHGRVTELYSHLLPEHLARARNAVNIGPGLTAVASAAGEAKSLRGPKARGTKASSR